MVTAVGVPLSAPVDVSSDNPAGRDGETEYETTVPPVDVTEVVVIAVPLVSVKEFVLYVIDGAISLTVIVTLAVSVPPVLVAVIVYEAEDVTAVGVPLSVPVDVSSDSPAGSDGETEYETTVPPVDVTEVVVMAVPLVRVNEVVLYAIDGAMSLTTIVTLAVSVPPVLVAVMV